MKKVKINNKEYTFKFSIEASLYNECTEATMGMLIGMGDAYNDDNAVDKAKKVISSISNIPQTALTMFYAGLLEYHGAEGDGSIMDMSDAKKVLADYLREYNKNFYDVMNDMVECMGNDNFFDLIGVSNIIGNPAKKKKSPKKEVAGENM